MPQPIWDVNLAAMRQRNPLLTSALLASQNASIQYIAGQAADGSQLLGVRLQDGQAISLSNPQQPKFEAHNWAKTLGEKFHKGACVLLLGFGDGYYAEALHALANNDTLIWIVEPDMELLKMAMQVRDLSGLILSKRVRIISGLPPKEAALSLFQGEHADRLKAQGFQMALAPFVNHIYPQYVQTLTQELSLALQLEAVKFNTWEKHADVMFSNVIANLPAVLCGAPVTRLLSTAVGETAFVIAPGPSLEDALPQIKVHQDRVVFIAVDTAHRILLKHGIRADIVISIDFTELNEKHFDGVEDDGTCLVAFPAISPRIPAKYVGRTFFYDHVGVGDSAGANPLLDELRLGPLGRLISQGSTAHAAYHLARLMGCRPIVLIGNDLGFPGKRFYANGAMQNDLDQTEREKEPLLDVESNDGGMIQTNGLYKIYLEGFRELIQETQGVVFNASKNGAKIKGCPYRPLDEMIAEIKPASLEKAFIQNALKPNLMVQQKVLKEQLVQIAEECKNARIEIRKKEKKLDKINPNGPQFRNQIASFMKEFQHTFRQYKTAITLSLSLCPRSYFNVVNKKDDAGFGAQSSLEERRLAHQRHLDLFRDLSKALRRINSNINEVVRNL